MVRLRIKLIIVGYAMAALAFLLPTSKSPALFTPTENAIAFIAVIGVVLAILEMGCEIIHQINIRVRKRGEGI